MCTQLKRTIFSLQEQQLEALCASCVPTSADLIVESSFMKASQTCQTEYTPLEPERKGGAVNISRGQSQEPGNGKKITIMAEQF